MGRGTNWHLLWAYCALTTLYLYPTQTQNTPPPPDGDDESLQQLTEATQHTMGVLRGGAPNPKLAFSSTTSHRGTPHPGLFDGTNPKSNQQATSKSVKVDKSH